MRRDLRTASGVALGVIAAVALPSLGRPAVLLLPLALLVAVLATVRTLAGSWPRAGIATVVGSGPGLILLGTTLDVTGLALPASASAIALQIGWTAASLTLGRTIAARVPDRLALTDVWGRFVAVGAVTAFIAGALVRLLGSGYDTATRLAWMLGEEDNAQIVGIAREVLSDGPRGAELAEQYGTAFVTLPFALIRMLGGPIGTEPDIRLQAITVFVVSTIVAIVIAGLAMALLAAIPQHVHRPERSERRLTPLRVMLGAVASGVAGLVGFSLLVVLPMRTGFLTFVWGLSIVLLAAALAASTPADAPLMTRAALVLHLVASGVLLLSSWPFIGPALVPLLLVPVLWTRWESIRNGLRQRPILAVTGAVASTGASALLVFWFLRWGPAAEVLSYGLDLLTVGGSGIYADDAVRQAAAAVTALLAIAIVAGTRGRSRSILLIGVLGPTVGAGLLYLGMRAASLALTDGALGYAGVKLIYGVVTIATVLGLVTLSGFVSRRSIPVVAGVLLVIGGVHQSGPTASLHQEWWGRTLQAGAPHAEAAVEAIRSTNSDLPIRCLPTPGTAVTDTTRWAAYFCARWMEDAFNEGRFDGRRFDLLGATDPTFEATIDRITSEHESEYLFAHRMTMGLGWFGWDGRAD